MLAVLGPQKQHQTWHCLGTFQSSVDSSAQDKHALGMENVAGMNGPNIFTIPWSKFTLPPCREFICIFRAPDLCHRSCCGYAQ